MILEETCILFSYAYYIG